MERKTFIRFRYGIIALGFTLIVASCTQNNLGLFTQSYPHERYYNRLKDHGISTTQMGTQWIETAERSLINATEAELPFSIKGIFSSHKAEAISWQFVLQEGASVILQAEWNTPDSSRLFMDVFQRNGNQWSHVVSADENDLKIEYESTADGQYLIRLQPELLATGQYELKINRTTTYSVFPVYGKDGKAIWSVFGDPRDGGGRRHEGIDIFAERGTPVLSPVKARVSSVRNGGLGGKSVFIRDGKRGHSLYFAHLDSQAVSIGKALNAGDTIGFVGNTGNARHTAPHLHFGIYKGFSGAIDPYPFVNDRFEEAKKIAVDFPEVDYFAINAAKANFRSGPGTKYPVLKSLQRGNIIFPKARNDDWYLAELPDHQWGYIHTSLLDLPEARNLQDTSDTRIFWDPFSSPADSVDIPLTGMKILGDYEGFQLLTNEKKILVWKRGSKVGSGRL